MHLQQYVYTYIHILCVLLNNACGMFLFCSAIAAVTLTSVQCKEQFDVLPDAQNAVLSAKRFGKLSKEPSMDAFNELGIIPVSIIVLNVVFYSQNLLEMYINMDILMYNILYSSLYCCNMIGFVNLRKPFNLFLNHGWNIS